MTPESRPSVHVPLGLNADTLRPGTGKTVTLVEAIRQVLSRNSNAKILACAPSNNAADIIADRLRAALDPSQLLRLNAPSRVKDLPQALHAYSLREDDGSFKVPAPAVMKNYRVVVATCASGSLPHGVGVKEGHFTHIFVDEAGQASEPEGESIHSNRGVELSCHVTSNDSHQAQCRPKYHRHPCGRPKATWTSHQEPHCKTAQSGRQLLGPSHVLEYV